MKSTGIVRRVDSLGRVVIPSELRKVMGYEDDQPLEICVDGDCVTLRKYVPEDERCPHCGGRMRSAD